MPRLKTPTRKEREESARHIAATDEALASSGGSPELRFALADLFSECPAPFVLDSDNDSQVVVNDCCGGGVFSNYVNCNNTMFATHEKKLHLRARLIARVLVQLSKENQ